MSTLFMLLVVAGVLGAGIFLAILFRKVVHTNMVHIVQSRKQTTSYGTGKEAGNVYYAWPGWVPFFGVSVIRLPVNNFDLRLSDYEAYDKDRVPFDVDVVAFFRIADTDRAAQRVSSIEDLVKQLEQVVQGAVRKVLASAQIDTIMLERAQFGDMFTSEVSEQLDEWGVEPVKAMELMDIRDGENGLTVKNIMAKKTSHIEMESRKEVASNHREAQTAEIEAARAVDIAKQEAEQSVGERTAKKEQQVGIAQQQSAQEILSQQKETRQRELAVERVAQVTTAEIQRDQQLIEADQEKQTQIIRAEGQLEAKKREATGIQVEGTARAEAEKAMQLAPVMAKIELAQAIAALPEYQNYLVKIAAVEASVLVGQANAQALTKADVKVIANTGGASDGLASIGELFTSKGATAVVGAIEAVMQSSTVQGLVGHKGNGALPEPISTEPARR